MNQLLNYLNMKTPRRYLCRTSAIPKPPSAGDHCGRFSALEEAGGTCPSRNAIRQAGRLSKWWGAVTALVCGGWLPLACGAQEVPSGPDVSSALPSTAWSPEGRQLFVAVLLLAMALILMERFCAWRLRIRWRETMAASQPSPNALAAVASASSAAPFRSVTSSQGHLHS